MASSKYKTQELARLYAAQKKEKGQLDTLQEKKILEALKKRLEELLQNPHKAQKAALIIESWINSQK